MGKTIVLVLLITVCLLVGIVGSSFTAPAIPIWYAGLVKPSFNPPSWLFGPVWTVLYVLMGISLWMVWQKRKSNKNVKKAIRLFGIQLILNAIWSPIFFGAKQLFIAFLVIVLMWIFVRKTILSFKEIDKKASRLLYPYLAWVSFATILNFSVWLLNR